jgi:hypothetical protein
VARFGLTFAGIVYQCERLQCFGKNKCYSLVLLAIQLFSHNSWGQDGGTLASVCASSSVDVVVLAFLIDFFGEDGLPVINFASSCGGPNFPGTDLLECPQIG